MPQADGLNPETRARLRYTARANIPGHFDSKTYDVLELSAGVRKTCDAFIAACLESGGSAPGVGLLLHGPPGTGKTTLAAAVLREVLQTAPRDWLGKGEYDAKLPGYFTMHTTFIQKHHESWGQGEVAEEAQDLIRSLYCRWTKFYTFRNTRLLVLDDAGKENPLVGTGHKSQVMHDVIRERYNASAPTILTTNLFPEAWQSEYGEATASFLNEGFISVPVNGKAWR